MPTLPESLHSALDAVAPQLVSMLDALGPHETISILDENALEQFVRAFVALLHEGIDGGREQRELVLTTAVPALVHAGQTPEQLLEAVVQFLMMLAPRMLEHVPAEQRDEAAVWLATFGGDYTRELVGRAREAGSS